MDRTIGQASRPSHHHTQLLCAPPFVKQIPDPPDITEGLKDKPFRLWMQYYGQNFHNLSKEDIKRVVASYMAQITLVANQIGHVVDFLRESGEIENTIVVFLSDHGDFAGNHGMIGKTNALAWPNNFGIRLWFISPRYLICLLSNWSFISSKYFL